MVFATVLVAVLTAVPFVRTLYNLPEIGLVNTWTPLPSTISPLPNNVVELIVLMLVPLTKVGCTATLPLPNKLVLLIVLMSVPLTKGVCRFKLPLPSNDAVQYQYHLLMELVLLYLHSVIMFEN